MTENDKIRDLERQARNTKRLMDCLNRATYGMTWEEYTRILCRKEEKPFDKGSGGAPHEND